MTFMKTWLGAGLGIGIAALAHMPIHAWSMSEPQLPRLNGDGLTATFVGKIFFGVYQDGTGWREAYLVDGRVDYEDDFRAAVGDWFVRDDLLCTFYDNGLDGGCFIVMQRGANCFAFYAVDPDTNQPVAGWDAVGGGFAWTAQGSRSDQAPTCPDGLSS